MADYTPVFLPGEIIPLTASGTISGGDPVAVSGSATVARAGSDANVTVVGVAGQDAVSTGRVTVFARGTVHESVADGTVTAGDQVGSSATAGRVKTVPASDLGATYVQATVNAAVNATRGVLGVALTTATTGNKVRWMSF